MEKNLGTIGMILAACTFGAVVMNWPAIMDLMGWQDDGAMGKRAKLVGALCSFAVLSPLLGLQLYLERRAARRPALGAAPGHEGDA